MKTIFSVLAIVTMAFVGMVSAEQPQDLVQMMDTLPMGKVLDLTGIDPDVFLGQMFMNDASWISGNSASWTPSQNAFLKDSPEESTGLGGEPLLLGSMAKSVSGTKVYFTPIQLSAFQTRYGNVSPETVLG